MALGNVGKHKCFNCGKTASIQIANTRPPVNKRWMCHNEKCWDVWQATLSHK